MAAVATIHVQGGGLLLLLNTTAVNEYNAMLR